MARLLPSSADASAAETGPRVIGLQSDDAEALLSAMSSTTARRLLGALHDDPAAASELADRIDTSLQNAQYHLGNLEEAGAVEVVDTVYSEKGREMKVYAPADDPLVVVAGDEERTAGVRDLLTSLLGGLGVLAVVAVLVQWLLAGPPGGAAGSGAGGVAAMDAVSSGGGALAALAEPGVVFFLGGAAVLLLGAAVRYARS